MAGTTARALLDRLLARRSGTHDPAALEALLATALDELARLAPAVRIDLDAFAAVLVGRLPRELALGVALERVRIADLALASACALGDPQALAAVDPILSGVVDSAAGRMRASEAVADEAKQVVRTILLVADGEDPPAIATYAGRGELRAWMRVVAVRELVRVQRGARRDVEFEDDALYEVLSPEEEPELGHLRKVVEGPFLTAFRQAVRSLTTKERLLLRQQSLDGLSIDELGTLHGVHRATAARWVARARSELLKRTRSILMESLGIGPKEADSILRLVRSRLDLSLEHALATRSRSSAPPVSGPKR